MKMLIVAALPLGTAQAQTQEDLNQRANNGFSRADAAMNAQYHATMEAGRKLDTLSGADLPQQERTGPDHQAALLASRRVWLRVRAAECIEESFKVVAVGGGDGLCVADGGYVDLRV